MGTTESKFIEELKDHNIVCENIVCFCGKHVYKILDLIFFKDLESKQIQYKAAKKVHCTKCHFDSNNKDLDNIGGVFETAIHKLSQLEQKCYCGNKIKPEFAAFSPVKNNNA